MNRQVINVLHERAKRIGLHILRHAPHRGINDWKDYDYEDLQIRILPGNTVRFTRNEHAWIEFFGISPARIEREILHDPVLIGKKIEDVVHNKITNQHNQTWNETVSYQVSQTKTIQHEIGASVTAALKVAVGTGMASPVQVSAELTNSVTASYNTKFGDSTTKTRTHTGSIMLNQGESANVVVKDSKANFEQRCEYWCDLEHGVTGFSDRDFSHTWSSMSQMKQAVEGLAPEGVPLAEHYRNKPMQTRYSDQFLKGITVYVDETVRFSNATSGEVTIT